MNKVTIQIVMLAACVTLANPALRADEPLKFTPMSEIVEQAIRPVSPHDACASKLYELAKAARATQLNTNGPIYMKTLDKAFDACVKQQSTQWVGNDYQALARCLSRPSMVAATKNDPETGDFLTQRVLRRKLYKGGPTLSFTLHSPLCGLRGAGQGCVIGATVGAALGAYGAVLHNGLFRTSKTTSRSESGNTQNESRNFTTTESTKTQGPTPLDALTGAKIGAVPGGLLGACAGFMIGGIKVSYNMR